MAQTFQFRCSACARTFRSEKGANLHVRRYCRVKGEGNNYNSAVVEVFEGGEIEIEGAGGEKEERKYNCSTCGKQFENERGVSYHERRWCRGGEMEMEGAGEEVEEACGSVDFDNFGGGEVEMEGAGGEVEEAGGSQRKWTKSIF